MATALLVGAGLSVGTDTSPHLERVNERISWNGEPIPDDELDRILGEIADVELVLDDRPSYFEILTAAALRVVRRRRGRRRGGRGRPGRALGRDQRGRRRRSRWSPT